MLPKIILGIGLFAALFSVLIFSGKLPIAKKQAVATGEVTLWGTLPETEMNYIIQRFNPEAKTYRVTYREVGEANFNQKLLEALANGTGPDLILAPYQIILAQSSRIYKFPLAYINESSFKTSYVGGASDVFWTQNGALALPVSIDPMVLFYNRTLFSKSGIVDAPLTWDNVSTAVPRLTLQNQRGQFIQSGIALGAPNTPYAKDILMTIVRQLGQKPTDSSSYDQNGGVYVNVIANQPVAGNSDIYPLTQATRFFVGFADATQNIYTWNQFSGNAEDAFVAEKLAMYIGYAGELATLRARNPRVEIEMANFPQTRGYNTSSTGMKMYGIATLLSSRNIIAALNVQSKLANEYSGGQGGIASITGAVPPFPNYAATPGLNSIVANSMLNARGWYDSFPLQSSLYTSNMISDILNNRQGISDAVGTFVSRMQDLYTPIK